MHMQAAPSFQATQHLSGQANRPCAGSGQHGYFSQDADSQAFTQTQPADKQPFRQSVNSGLHAPSSSHGTAYQPPGQALTHSGKNAGVKAKTGTTARVKDQGSAEAAAEPQAAKGWTALQDLKLVKKGERTNLKGWLRARPTDVSQGRTELTKILLFASKEIVHDNCKALIMLNDPAKTRWVACLAVNPSVLLLHCIGTQEASDGNVLEY